MERDERVVEQVERVESSDAGAPPPVPGAPPPLGGDREQAVVRETETTRRRPDGALETDRLRVEDRRRTTGERLGLALIVLLLLAAAAFAGWWFLVRDDQTTSVPAVEGMSAGEAVSRLQQDGFATQTTTQPDDVVPEGHVVDQQPSAGTDADDGSTVSLVVSGGPSSATVPNAVGVTEAEARDRLVQAGFQVISHEVFSDEPAGTVVAQSPAAGSQADPNAQVTINVSKGSGRVEVPNVVGQTRAEAQATLSDAGLEADVAEVPSSEAQGTVVAQHPVGGEVQKGSAVRINVSSG